jgi:hypothetical protein
MAIEVGSMVKVNFPPARKRIATNDPARKLHGQVFVVKSRKSIYQSDTDVKWLYELYGANSKKGMPYTFIEENLELIEEGEEE